MTAILTTPQQFFYEHAGYSWNPKTETAEQGRIRCAISYADAERRAHEEGFFFLWSQDPDVDSSDFSDEQPPWALWQCAMCNADGDTVQYLGGIDFGRYGSPWGDNYRRVVEAELAAQHFSE